jgi:hypothetical protein
MAMPDDPDRSTEKQGAAREQEEYFLKQWLT